MKNIELIGNVNYSAQIFTVPEVRKALNSDRLYTFDFGGSSVVVDESWIDRAGTRAVIFFPESQLSDTLASSANLYRHSDKNSDETVKGYLEDNRRVRAIRLRGNPSNALVLPIETVAAAFKAKPEDFDGVTSFDHIRGVEVVRKYEIPVNRGSVQASSVKKAFKRVTTTQLPEHYDTSNYFRFSGNIPDDARITVTQKLHGTSVRLGRVQMLRKLTWLDKVAQFFGVRVQQFEHDTVAGSRKVIKDVNNVSHDHYYSYDLWTDMLRVYEDLIPENFVLYGEIVGWTKDGSPIQRNYTYDVPKGEAELYVYRVAVVTDGEIVDLTWPEVERFCSVRGIKTVPTLYHNVSKNNFDVMILPTLIEKNYHKEVDPKCVPLSEGGPGVDEGFAVRVDTARGPQFYKGKNTSFLEHETKILDSGEADLESEQSEEQSE